MNPEEWELDYYIAPNGRAPYQEWYKSLNDSKTRQIILKRLARIRSGNFGTCELVGFGVFEFKIDYGPGFRIYFSKSGEKIILLLCGGNKSSQHKDIQMAHHYWGNYKELK